MLPVAHVFALVIMGFAATMLAPLILALWGRDLALGSFVLSAAATFAIGALLWLTTRRYKRELKTRDGLLLVALTWVALPAVAGFPLWHYLPIDFTHAYFEAASGLTTTGGTVLSGLQYLPRSINLWRHLLSWLGGMGIIVLAVAILPMLGVGGMQIYRAEMPGPMKDAKLTPRIGQTAKLLWTIYAGLTLACIVTLRLVGMNWFDAVCHGFSALSLGGFSTYDDSVGHFHSLPIEMVLTVFQILAALNFATHFQAWSQRGIRAYFRDSEAKAIIGVLAASSVGIAFYLFLKGTYADFWTALREATFNVVSIGTDGGLHTQDYSRWPVFAPMWMLFLSCIVASSGSTGGGIKMIRTLILAKQANRELDQIVHPNLVRPLKIGGTVIANRVVFAVLGFVFLYFMSLVTLVFVELASGLDFTTSLSAILACINNVGPGLGLVGPDSNYSVLNDFQTWICSFAMLLGRLEVFTILVLFTPTLWRK
ncbi:MAG: TrkH family potassium uptake protein [Steroidobacteraceae bacterium]|nr:TrkH family potassium uptake protein [Steroidobacteraceae bacterium]